MVTEVSKLSQGEFWNFLSISGSGVKSRRSAPRGFQHAMDPTHLPAGCTPASQPAPRNSHLLGSLLFSEIRMGQIADNAWATGHPDKDPTAEAIM